MQINEEKHILTDYNIDKMIENILSALHYNMYKQAMDGNIKFDVYHEKFLGGGVDPRAAGRDFDEYLKFIENERRNAENEFKFPIVSEFRLTENENPCKDFISSDCLYKFTFVKFSGGQFAHHTDMDNAFVSEGVLHNASFEFVCVFGDISMLREGIRHEIKHAYDELLKHISKSKEGKLGTFKADGDKERDELYSKVVSTLGMMTRDDRGDFNMRRMKKSMEVILRCLYLLYEPEIHANYSEYYQEIMNDPKKHHTDHEAYKKYYNMSTDALIGIDVLTDPDENGYEKMVRIDPFDDDVVFGKPKTVANKMLKYQRNFSNGKELKDEILRRSERVLKEMKKIYDVFVGEKKSTKDTYNESFDNYYKDRLNELQESLGEINGLYEFTKLKYYNEIPFSREFKKIDELFK